MDQPLWTYHPGPATLDPPPWTRHPGPTTLDLPPWTYHPGPATLDQPPCTCHSGPATLDLPPWTSHPGPATLHLPLWTSHPGPATLDPPPWTRHPGPHLFISDILGRVSSWLLHCCQTQHLQQMILHHISTWLSTRSGEHRNWNHMLTIIYMYTVHVREMCTVTCTSLGT